MVGGQRAGYAVSPGTGTERLQGRPVSLAPLQEEHNFPYSGGSAGSGSAAVAAASSSSAPAMSAGQPLLAAPAPPAPDNSGDARMHGDSDVGRPKVRVLASPMTPTPEEVAEHNVCHIPHRAWCRHCVAGRGKADQHRTSEVDGQVPVIHTDYGFLGEKRDVEQIESSIIPFIIVKDGPPPAGFSRSPE